MITFLGTTKTLELYRDVIAKSKDDIPDIVVSCQYPHLVPASIINNNICVNIHYGILPQYSGCNPIYWQMIKGNEAGVTLHYMDRRFDSGNIVEIKKIPIKNMTADQVFDSLGLIGRELFIKHYRNILRGTAPTTEQDLSKRKYYKKEDINFQEAKNLGKIFIDDRRVRALHFEGKQYPVVEIENVKYELRRVRC